MYTENKSLVCFRRSTFFFMYPDQTLYTLNEQAKISIISIVRQLARDGTRGGQGGSGCNQSGESNYPIQI